MQKTKSCLHHLSRVALFVGVALILSHCGQITLPGGHNNESLRARPRSGTFASVYSILQSANCTQCHAPSGGSAASNDGTAIDFTTAATAYRTLTGGAHVRGNGAGSSCAGVQLVDRSAAQSYLPFAIFAADQNFASPHFQKGPDCAVYPVAGHDVNFSADEEASILAWIEAGAPNN